MREKVLITGASGFVGYHLILEALKNDLDVFAAIRPGSDTAHLQSLPIQYITHSFNDPEKLGAELKKNQYQYIIHAAGRTKAANQEEYNLANASLTRNLAMAAVTNGGVSLRKFIFISSLAAIGPNTNSDELIDADAEPRPVTAYGRSKLLAEKYLSEVNGLPLITLRPTAVYGPRERDLFVVIKSIAGGIEPYIGQSAQKLSFVYVKDLARVTLIALLSPEGKPAAYNISDGRVYDKYSFGDLTRHILGKKTIRFTIPVTVVRILAFVLEKVYTFSSNPPVLNQDKVNELIAANWSVSIDRAKNELGYVPAYTLETGLEETIDWYKKNSWLN